MPSRIQVATDQHCASITLAHAPVNVIDITMMEELAGALADIEHHHEISVIVFQGEGPSFSAGVDIAAHTPEQIDEMLAKFHAVIRAIVASTKITVAAVHGRCLGGGAELALVCDIVYSTIDAEWGFPEIKLGCFPPVACATLAAIVGQKRATQLILTGEIIHGNDAMLIGLATASGPPAEMQAELKRLIETLGKLSPAALKVTKRALYAFDAFHFDKGLAKSEKIYLQELMSTHDAREGVSAWMEKRAPKWTGK